MILQEILSFELFVERFIFSFRNLEKKQWKGDIELLIIIIHRIITGQRNK